MQTEFGSALDAVRDPFIPIIDPPEPIAPSRWAAKYLIMPDGQRVGGKWDPLLTPYVPDIIDALGPGSTHNLVAVRKGVQTGITIAGIALAGSYIDRSPCRIGYALPTITLVQEFNAEKLAPCIEMSPALKAKVRPQMSRSGVGSTTTRKKYPGGSLSLINANSAPDLKSRTLKVGIADEVDAWPDSVGDDGDPFGLFLDRFTVFQASGEWRLLALSTPTIKGASRIDSMFEEGDQRYWHITCPGCDEKIPLEFRHLEFNRVQPYDAHYVAQCCGTVIESNERTRLLRNGEFIATNPEGLHPSFHVDELISQFTTWDDIAGAWWKAHGVEEKERRFYNSILGRSYEVKGDAPDWELLMARREDYKEGTIPEPGLILVCGVDVQHNGLWFEVIVYGSDRQSWCIRHGFIEGATDDPNAGAWNGLAEIYDHRFPDAFGGTRRIEAMAIDAGDGGRANQVYHWSRSRDRAHAIYGRSGWPTPAIGTPTRVDVTIGGKRIRAGALLWPVGIWSLKGDHYAHLRKQKGDDGTAPAGYCHFGMFCGQNYFKQITSEYLETETFRGRPRKVWKLRFDDNHLFDCRVYAMAMADKLGMNRMTPNQWEDLAGLLNVPKEFAETNIPDVRPAFMQKRRKVRRSNWMN